MTQDMCVVVWLCVYGRWEEEVRVCGGGGGVGGGGVCGTMWSGAELTGVTHLFSENAGV